MISKSILVFFCLSVGCLVAHADSAPFGVLSAYNLVALGTTGPGAIAGNVATDSDVGGRIAAANDVTEITTIGGGLNADPWGSLAGGYEMVAGGGVTTTSSVNVNGGGNIYAPSSSAHYNFNERGSLVTTGSSPINFATERTAMDTLNSNLATLTSNGTVGCATGSNPSWTGLCGTSATLNVFTLTAAQFGDDQLDFIIPNAQSGATIIVNVLGGSDSLNQALLINGQQESDSVDDNGLILFNFIDATNVSINAQFDASILAPNATLTGGSQMGGNFIVGAVNQTGEVHNDEFVGTIPSFVFSAEAPEPASLLLMGTGLLFLAGLLRVRKRPTKA